MSVYLRLVEPRSENRSVPVTGIPHPLRLEFVIASGVHPLLLGW